MTNDKPQRRPDLKNVFIYDFSMIELQKTKKVGFPTFFGYVKASLDIAVSA